MGSLCCGGTGSRGGAGDGHDTASDDDKVQKKQETPTPPHMFHDIVAGEKPTPAEDQAYAGILLAGKTKKYWVDEKTKSNHFMLFPRGLSITWSEDPRHWTWRPLKEASDTEVETASLKQVTRLDIQGKQGLSHLTPGVTYEVFFEVMLSESAEGWAAPVKLAIKFPDGTILQREETLQERQKHLGQWQDIKVGEVTAHKDQKGEMEISMFEHGRHLKTGLVVKGIKIVPKE